MPGAFLLILAVCLAILLPARVHLGSVLIDAQPALQLLGAALLLSHLRRPFQGGCPVDRRNGTICARHPFAGRRQTVHGANLSRMGFLSRLLIPRSVRRAAHPGRAVKRAITPKAVKRARRAMHPVSNAVYGVERSLNTKKKRRAARSPIYRHGTCPVNHRTPEAAAKCRRTS